jgi:hypothetical protein
MPTQNLRVGFSATATSVGERGNDVSLTSFSGDHAREKSHHPTERVLPRPANIVTGCVARAWLIAAEAAQPRRDLICAKNLPRNSPASCLRGIADDLRAADEAK